VNVDRDLRCPKCGNTETLFFKPKDCPGLIRISDAQVKLSLAEDSPIRCFSVDDDEKFCGHSGTLAEFLADDEIPF
jgi:hypothetical protein